MRGDADRHYGKRNALTLELDNNHLLAEYTMAIHNSSRRSQKAARYLYNAGGSATSFNLFKIFWLPEVFKMLPTITSTFHKLKTVEFLKSLGEHVQQIHPI